MLNTECSFPSHYFSSNHIQRLLSRKPADSFAITGEIAFYHLSSTVAGQSVKYQAHRFVNGAAGGSGNAGDPHAEGGAATLADSLGHGFGDFRTHCPILLDEIGRNRRELGLQFVRIDDRASEKISRTSAHGSDALCQKSSGTGLCVG